MPSMRRFARKIVLSLAIAAALGTAYLADAQGSDRAAAPAAAVTVADDFSWS
ncbi:hypothetical protein ACPC54_03685 [Kitasatospora sp. NPDC094028]